MPSSNRLSHFVVATTVLLALLALCGLVLGAGPLQAQPAAASLAKAQLANADLCTAEPVTFTNSTQQAISATGVKCRSKCTTRDRVMCTTHVRFGVYHWANVAAGYDETWDALSHDSAGRVSVPSFLRLRWR